MTRGAANGRRSWRFWGAGGVGSTSPVSARLSEWRERAPASSPGRPVPQPPTPPPRSRAQPQAEPPGAPCLTALAPGPQPGPRPGPRASGARGRSAPGHSERCAAGQRRPRRWSCCCRRRRPARPAPPAARAPERRARSSSAPTQPPAPQAARAPSAPPWAPRVLPRRGNLLRARAPAHYGPQADGGRRRGARPPGAGLRAGECSERPPRCRLPHQVYLLRRQRGLPRAGPPGGSPGHPPQRRAPVSTPAPPCLTRATHLGPTEGPPGARSFLLLGRASCSLCLHPLLHRILHSLSWGSVALGRSGERGLEDPSDEQRAVSLQG